ncbi:MAG: AMP-binding protein, partial [Lewinella sp.]|nr:AMP-binding protein [Lewinella sp.]
MRAEGVGPGDRVAAYLPNLPEAIACFLATASLGAIWSCCSPDFGVETVVERFVQIEPKVFITVDGYRYGGKAFDRLPEAAALQAALPSVKAVLLLPYLQPEARLPGATLWSALPPAPAEPLTFAALPFGHPLWILYSSGTTGRPKAITHSHGGALLEHLKYLAFHNDAQAGEHFFWFTTTGWMMWNFLQA